jgi:hypothetical protein
MIHPLMRSLPEIKNLTFYLTLTFIIRLTFQFRTKIIILSLHTFRKNLRKLTNSLKVEIMINLNVPSSRSYFALKNAKNV